MEMKSTFLSPGKGRLLAKGVVLRRTSSIAFCEASVLDADDVLVARSSGTFKYVSQPQRGG
jgi:acyl-coenzyme A thioesterase PaaI-like protein